MTKVTEQKHALLFFFFFNDAHGLGGDADVGVHLLQHLIDVHGVGFFAPAAPSGLLVPRTPAAPAPRLLQLSVLSAHPPGPPGLTFIIKIL